MSRVLFVGGATLDLLARVDHFPKADRRYVMADPVWSIGGPALVAGLAYARLLPDSEIACFSWIGTDVGGATIQNRLRVERVQWVGHELAGQSSSTSIVISDQSQATRTILTHPLLIPDDVYAMALPGIAHWKPDWVHLDCYWPSFSWDVIQWAHGHGVPVSLDLSHVRGPLIERMARCAQICIADDATAQTLANNVGGTIKQFRNWGVPIGGVTQGQAGCAIATHAEAIRVSAAPVAIQDTTGAGDVFHGSFLAGFLASSNMVTAAQWATAAAGLSTTSMGSQLARIDRNTVERLAESLPVYTL